MCASGMETRSDEIALNNGNNTKDKFIIFIKVLKKLLNIHYELENISVIFYEQ